MEYWRMLWKWSKRRHSGKRPMMWVKARYFKRHKGLDWIFYAVDKDRYEQTIFRASAVKIQRHAKIKALAKKRDKIYDININIGIAYVKLLNHSAKDINEMDVTNQIVFDKKDAFHLQSGLTYKFAKNLGLNFKATVPIRVEDWTIAARIIYMIN